MAQMDALALEAAEEVFGHGVVIGIALAGHALPDAEAGETLTVSVGGVLERRARRLGAMGCACLELVVAFVGTPARGGDVHLVHQAVDALARAGKLRADQVIQAVQPKGGITLVQYTGTGSGCAAGGIPRCGGFRM